MRNVILASLIVLTSCSSAPKPPVVDGSDRQAVNSPEMIEILDLRKKLALSDAKLLVEQSRPTLVDISTLNPLPKSQTFSYYFPENRTKFRLNSEEESRLLPALARARRVEVRGRTDSERPTSSDEKVALKRALDAQNYLIGQGVPASIISINYVSAGDRIADNVSAIGRATNRRVDIEVFN